MNKTSLMTAVALAAALASGALHAQNSFGGNNRTQQQQQPQQPQPMPPGQFPQQPAPSGYGNPNQPPPQQQPQGGGNERQDMGVRAPAGLHSGPMHGPTPNSIPGAQLITTVGLVDLLKNHGQRVRVFDVLGGPERLPNALNAVPAHQGGSFDDQTQREFGNFLQQVTQGAQDTPLVFYCQSTMCWMSYNAALRASRMGYKNVLWYRGGVEAWKAAGQPLQTAGGPMPQQQQQQMPPMQGQQPMR